MQELSDRAIVSEIDEIESDIFTLYRRLERLRLKLQAQWRVLPSLDGPAGGARGAGDERSSERATPQSTGVFGEA